MKDHKLLQSGDSEYSIPDHPHKPYEPERRSTESPAKAAQTINAFYANKEQYNAFVSLVGKDQAMLWMANLLQRISNDI